MLSDRIGRKQASMFSSLQVPDQNKTATSANLLGSGRILTGACCRGNIQQKHAKEICIAWERKIVKWATLCGSYKWQSRNTQGLVFQDVSEEVPSYSEFDPRHFVSRSSTTVTIIINKQQWWNGSGRDSSLATMTSQRCWKMSKDGAAQSRCYVTSRNSEGNKQIFHSSHLFESNPV